MSTLAYLTQVSGKPVRTWVKYLKVKKGLLALKLYLTSAVVAAIIQGKVRYLKVDLTS